MTKKDTIKAPSNLPHKQKRNLIFEVLILLVWVAVSIIASQFIVSILMMWILGVDRSSQPVPTAIYSALSYTLAMCLIIFVPPKISQKWRKNTIKKSDRQSLGLKGLPTWTDIGLAPVGFIVYLILAAVIVAIFSNFPWFDASEAQNQIFSYSVMGFDRVVAFLTLVVIAPIAEEVIFRGFLYGKLRAKFSSFTTNAVSMVLSAFLVSLLFGLVHQHWNVSVNVFAMSLVLCALREITGTIYSGILLHMLKNGVAFYMLYISGFGL